MLLTTSLGGALSAAAEPDVVAFAQEPGKVLVTVDGKTLATYVFEDKRISRPYFANVRAPGGVQVTRNHPPVKGEDPQDHATYHPGIWLAFGDISGNDYWRLKAKVLHDGFVKAPQGGLGRGGFTVRNRYLSKDDKSTVCTEICRYTFPVPPEGYLIVSDSIFQSDGGDFYFGDQEEMGLGVRVASPIRERAGNGRILSSEGLQGARITWGQPAAWCDYAGKISGKHAGVTIMASPNNIRESWWHNRDYGVFVANLFGREAVRQGPSRKIVVEKGKPFRLGYGVLLHASDGKDGPNLAKAYEAYKSIIQGKKRKQG